MTDGEERRGMPRWARRWAIIAAVVLATLIGFAGYRLTLRGRVHSRIEAIRAAGYPTTPAELDAWYAAPGLGRNAAVLYEEAAELRVKPTDEEAEILPCVGEADVPPPGSMSPELKRRIRDYLARNKKALDLLHKAASYDACRYSIDFTRGLSTDLGVLRPIRRLTQLLQLEAVFHAENGDAKAATTSVASCAALARSTSGCPRVIPFLAQLACRHITARALAKTLSRTALTDAQLRGLEPLFDTGERIGLTAALAGWRCLCIGVYDDFRAGRQGETFRVASWLGALDRDQVFFMDATTRVVEASRLPLPDRLDAIEKIDEENTKEHAARADQPTLSRFISDLFFIEDGPVFIEGADGIGRYRLARTAIAIERFRLKHRALPETLAELVPDWLPQVPADPFTGKPIGYKRLPKGYRLYSVGRDRVDDGGSTEPGEKGRPRDTVFAVER